MLDTGIGVYLIISTFLLVCLTWYREYWGNHSHPPLPPGPPALPVLGSILSLSDLARPWLSFSGWRSTYGDIIYARLLNKPIIMVNSEEVARDLFELRSTIYSDRPRSIAFEHFATEFNIVIMPYGDRWRLHRRIFHQSFRETIIPTYHAELGHSAQKMLFSFLKDPTNYADHFHMFICSFIMPIVYGYEPKAENDHIIHNMRSYVDLSTAALGSTPTMIMETFPFLLRLPVWFPGATFKRTSVMCLQVAHDMKEVPFQYTKERMSTGEMPPCVVADTMNSMGGFENDAIGTAIKEAASLAFSVSAETASGTCFASAIAFILASAQTSSTLQVFLLAMVLHPDVQARAQKDIDQVVGKDRLPNFHDRPALPYVDAILRETLRWYPVTPMGIPHTTTTDDIYKGYFIPKGVAVVANIWAMARNEDKYPSPDKFNPERFLYDNGSLTGDKVSFAFGWGRRKCVGRHLADAAVWIAATTFLCTFSVHKALDEHGREIPVVPKFSVGITAPPEPFPCRIVPRVGDASVEKLMQLTGFDLPVN